MQAKGHPENGTLLKVVRVQRIHVPARVKGKAARSDGVWMTGVNKALVRKRGGWAMNRQLGSNV